MTCIDLGLPILPDSGDNTKVVIGGVLGALVALVTIAAGVLFILVVVLAMYVTFTLHVYTQWSLRTP